MNHLLVSVIICNILIVKIIADLVISLKMLEKIKSFHGRLKLNNVHIDKSFKVKLNDYGIYNEIYRGHRKTQPSELTSNHNASLSSGKGLKWFIKL
jgi:hypothetical protein